MGNPQRDPPNLMLAFDQRFEVPKNAICIRRMADGKYAWFNYMPVMVLKNNRYEWSVNGCRGMNWDYCEPWIERH